MGDVVDPEHQQVQQEQGQLGGGVDGGDESEEDVEGEGEEEDPGDDLLGMKGKLESVNTAPFPELLGRWGRVVSWL